MAATEDEGAAAQGTTKTVSELASLRPTRVALGWTPTGEAIQQLLGRAPAPTDDLTEVTKRIVAAQAAVQARDVCTAADPIVTGDQVILQQLAERQDIRAAFANVNWTVEWVNLAKLQTIQKFIYTDGLDLRVAGATMNVASLIDLCYPTQITEEIRIDQDADGLGFTASSLNPHLQAIGLPMQQVMVAQGGGSLPQALPGKAVAIMVGMSHLQVTRYRGRFIVRDGNHRIAGLLRAGVTEAPSVIIDAPTWEYVAPLPGLLEESVVMGKHAPLVADFWDQQVSADGWLPRLRTVVRFRAEKFVLPN